MAPSIHIRVLGPADLPFADSLRELAGWNQTRADWQRFLAMAPQGCFLAEWEGKPAGTATTLGYGTDVAWIGMVLVQPELRRLGIGKALLNHCIAWLREQGVRAIKLDATPAGKLVYDALGFRDEWTLARWEHPGLAISAPTDQRIRPWQVGDEELVAELDARAFGVARRELLAALSQQSRGFVWELAPGRVQGFGFIRPGMRAAYLGPIVAESDEAGIALVEALLQPGPGRVFWDIPDANAGAVEWARRQGFAQQRVLTRMVLGENQTPGNPAWQFALAAPEVG